MGWFPQVTAPQKVASRGSVVPAWVARNHGGLGINTDLFGLVHVSLATIKNRFVNIFRNKIICTCTSVKNKNSGGSAGGILRETISR